MDDNLEAVLQIPGEQMSVGKTAGYSHETTWTPKENGPPPLAFFRALGRLFRF